MHRMAYKNIVSLLPMTIDVMKSHWALREYNIAGDSIISFIGPFDVGHDDFLDYRTQGDKDVIHRGVDMLHFIVEHFEDSLDLAIYRQCLLVSIVEEKLDRRLGKGHMIRWGEVLYDGQDRLSVSAVTKNPVSTKIHLGLFLDDEPEKNIKGLSSFNLAPLDFAQFIVGQYRAEFKRLADKRWNIRPL